MDQHLEGFFDELEKIGGLVDAFIKNVATNPVKYYAADRRMSKGMARHRQAVEALENNTPAGWGPLGMHAE